MKKLKVMLLFLILPVLFGGVYFLALVVFNDGPEISRVSTEVNSAVSAAFAQAHIAPTAVKKNLVKKEQGILRWNQTEIVAQVDEGVSLPDLTSQIRSSLTRAPVNVKEQSQTRDATNETQLWIYYRDLPLYQILIKQKRLPPPQEEPQPEPVEKEVQEDINAPRIALIVDDVGYDLERALELLNLRFPMTISIFPQLLYSKRIAETAHKMGYEIMMHLPMESEEHLRRNPGFIMQGMPKDELFWVIDRDLESIPYVKGVNNHQGSKMTADRDAMVLVMQHLAEKNLYFIDSRTTSDSVAYEVAREYGIQTAENNAFLDNIKELDYIKERIQILVTKAEADGTAIGICHVNPVTTLALRESLPLIEQRKIRLVYVSEVLK